MIDPLSAETALLVAPAVLLLWAFWVLRSESAVRRDWLVLLSASTRRIVDGRAHAERAWEHIRAIRHDLETLSHETLDSLRVLLVSLAAEKREDLLRRL